MGNWQPQDGMTSSRQLVNKNGRYHHILPLGVVAVLNEAIFLKSQNGPGGKEQAEQFSDELNCYLNFGLFPTTIPAIRDPAHL